MITYNQDEKENADTILNRHNIKRSLIENQTNDAANHKSLNETENGTGLVTVEIVGRTLSQRRQLHKKATINGGACIL